MKSLGVVPEDIANLNVTPGVEVNLALPGGGASRGTSCAKQNKIRKNHMQRFGFVQVKCGRAHSRRWCFPTIYLLLSQCTGLLCLWSLVMVELGRMGGALGGWILAAYDSLAVFKCLRKMGRGNTSSSARSWAARITEQLYFCAAHRRANRPHRLS